MAFEGNPHFSRGNTIPRPRPLGPQVRQSSNIYNAPARIDAYQVQIREYIARQMEAATATRADVYGAPKVKRGDKVSLNVVAYVSKVNDDGTVAVSSSSDAFADPIVLDRVHRTRLTIRQVGPAEPRVGDVVTGVVVHATPWKRGTVLTWLGDDGDTETLVLMPDGTWTSASTGAASLSFAVIKDCGKFRVEYAPGKAAA